MTALNHAVTGALIGFVSGNPLMALPAAFLSHFVCDAIPHYGSVGGKTWTKAFKLYLLTDALLCVMLAGLIAYRHPVHWVLAAFCAFAATSPDLLWVKKFIYGLKHKRQYKHTSKLDYALGSDGIQWFQRPIGAVVEVAWLVGIGALLFQFIK